MSVSAANKMRAEGVLSDYAELVPDARSRAAGE